MLIKAFFIFLFFSLPAKAHTFTTMIGFYDGLSHPVLGLDHFIAMISVGIISAQIKGKAIWLVPLTFVLMMIIGGILGMMNEFNSSYDTQVVALNQINIYSTDFVYRAIEIGIILSVILLGLVILIDKKMSIKITIFFICIFGLCHGAAHGIEMPWASNPILFGLGFSVGTATLHLFGVGIGFYFMKKKLSSLLLRFLGLCFVICGVYFFINI